MIISWRVQELHEVYWGFKLCAFFFIKPFVCGRWRMLADWIVHFLRFTVFLFSFLFSSTHFDEAFTFSFSFVASRSLLVAVAGTGCHGDRPPFSSSMSAMLERVSTDLTALFVFRWNLRRPSPRCARIDKYRSATFSVSLTWDSFSPEKKHPIAPNRIRN